MGSLLRLAPALLWLWSGAAAAEGAMRAAAEPSALRLLVQQAVGALLIMALLAVAYSVVAHRRRHPSRGLWTWLLVPLLLLSLDIGLAKDTHWWQVSRASAGDALEVRVTAHEGWWEYEYGGGVRLASFSRARAHGSDDSHLILPAGRSIRLLETSSDVVHAFAVPELGIQNDAIPGYFTETRITPEHEGLFRGTCPGCADSSPARVVVEIVTGRTFDEWLAERRSAAGDRR